MEWFCRNKFAKLSFLIKKLEYQCHEKDYKEALDQNLVAFNTKINKLPAIWPLSRDISNSWNRIQYNTLKHLVELLLTEMDNVAEKKTKKSFQDSLKERYLSNFRKQ